MESIVKLLYITATNFGSKKFGNLEEGKSVNDLRVCEIICTRKFLHVKFSFFSKGDNNIFKNEAPE